MFGFELSFESVIKALGSEYGGLFILLGIVLVAFIVVPFFVNLKGRNPYANGLSSFWITRMDYLEDTRISQEDIKKLSDSLKEILYKELELGNEVKETWSGDWPYKNTIVVMLRHPFKAHYQGEGLDLVEINDMHFWKAQYRDTACDHLLICGFEDTDLLERD